MDWNKIIKDFSKLHKELQNVKIKIGMDDGTYEGMCYSENFGEFTYEGKLRMKQINTSCIILKNATINVLLHEMAHAITPYCERKRKEEWIRIDKN